uniref:Uncharacterized protein n=1 Tax=Amphimedon queenslandica TaxID=400682 RepID=A0A1X7TBQ1_AMPQE
MFYAVSRCLYRYGHLLGVGVSMRKYDYYSTQHDMRLDCVDGWTPLIWAAYYGHTQVVTMLLEKGADVTASDYVSRVIFAAANICDFFLRLAIAIATRCYFN